MADAVMARRTSLNECGEEEILGDISGGGDIHITKEILI
jgi:hypothetical protein